jgi:hypothetical protein
VQEFDDIRITDHAERRSVERAFIFRICREALWAPLAVIIAHGVAGKMFGQEQSYDALLCRSHAWAEATNTKFGRSPGANPWKEFATFLYGGKIYE